MRYSKEILFAFALTISTLILWYTADVFFLAFASILLALLLNSIGHLTQKLIRLPYIPSLLIGLFVITGIFTLIFWLYTPLIVDQFEQLAQDLPAAALSLRDAFLAYLPENLFSTENLKQEFSQSRETIFTQVMTIFSSTVGTLIGFIVFVIVGFYLTMMPGRYLKGFMFMMPEKKTQRIWKALQRIGTSLRYWLLGKILSMIAIGILTCLGLWLLDIPLAFVLGLLAGLLTFIPYVGPILAAIPAVLIAFASNPIHAVYVILLYIGIHIVEGYFITPVIEQKTVFIPPALTIMAQILTFALFGGIGLALASPLVVVILSLCIHLKGSGKVANQA